MQTLKSLLLDGIKMEDEFIQSYFSVIKDADFSQYFTDESRAREILETLIEESKWHKKTLEEIVNKI